MKQITPPKAIAIKDFATGLVGETVTFRMLAVARWINSENARAQCDTIPKLLKWGKVIEKIMAAEDMVPFCLEDADYDLLRPVVEADAVAHAPAVGLQLLPLYQCVLEAKAP